MGDTGIYTFHFNLVGTVEIEADSLDEAWDLFYDIDDYSEHVNNIDPYDVTVED